MPRPHFSARPATPSSARSRTYQRARAPLGHRLFRPPHRLLRHPTLQRALGLEDAQPAGAPLKPSRHDAEQDLQRAEALRKEPLRIIVVGQTKSGKSSLINALFDEYRAATDVVPRTDQVEPYVPESRGAAGRDRSRYGRIRPCRSAAVVAAADGSASRL